MIQLKEALVESDEILISANAVKTDFINYIAVVVTTQLKEFTS